MKSETLIYFTKKFIMKFFNTLIVSRSIYLVPVTAQVTNSSICRGHLGMFYYIFSFPKISLNSRTSTIVVTLEKWSEYSLFFLQLWSLSLYIYIYIYSLFGLFNIVTLNVYFFKSYTTNIKCY